MSWKRSRWGKEYDAKAKQFYNSKAWKDLRDQVRRDKGMRSDLSGKLIKGKSIVHHVIELTPDNIDNPDIALNPDNLQLVSFEEHQNLTFGKGERTYYEPDESRDINLF